VTNHDVRRQGRDRLRSGSRLRGASLALALGALLAAGPAAAGAGGATGQGDNLENEAELGIAAGLASVVYAPVKVAYALGGSIVAGLAYALSGGDMDVARPVLDASLRGDYVVTPSHLTGQRELEFVGRTPEDRALRSSAAAAPPAVSAAAAPHGDGLDGTTPRSSVPE
jgi:hypothetical protein